MSNENRGNQVNLRKVALEILNEVELDSAYSNLTINKYVKKYEIKEAGLLRELVYGVIENKIYIDYVLRQLITKGFNKLDGALVNILRLGVYQMKYLDSIPAYAAVNESVKLSRKVSSRHSKFINGVLRNYERNMDKIKLPNKNKELVKYLSIVYSSEEWMINTWLKEYDVDFVEELLKSSNATPPLTIRVNRLKTTVDELKSRLEEQGFTVTKGNCCEQSLHVLGSQLIYNNPLYDQGLFQIQDESSMIAINTLDPQPGETIIDVCAAPGGKTMFMAEKMNNKGRIIARDIFEHKIKLLESDQKRLGIDIIEPVVFDATQIDETMINKADRVLCDAPCSGLGVIRRKPEIKYNRKEEEINELSKLQLQILFNASKYVKDKGVLLYSTCTLTSEENEKVVEAFLKDNNSFSYADSKKYVHLYPHIDGTDGFFICKLRKNNDI